MGTPLLHSFDDAASMYEAAGSAVLQLLREALQARGVCHLALAGGNTPRPLYEWLAEQPTALDWSNVHFWWGDERCVPPGHEHSNYRVASEAWLSTLALPKEHVHRIRGELGAHRAANEYAAEFEELLGAKPVLDLVLLGVGEDGHTASLFPGDEHDAGASVLAIANAPKPPAERVSLSAATLCAARRRIFLASGPEKRRVLEAMTGGADTPAGHIAAANPSSIYYY